MPAVVNSMVGSVGTSGAEGTTVWPWPAKKSRNARRSSVEARGVVEVCGEVIPSPVPERPKRYGRGRRKIVDCGGDLHDGRPGRPPWTAAPDGHGGNRRAGC